MRSLRRCREGESDLSDAFEQMGLFVVRGLLDGLAAILEPVIIAVKHVNDIGTATLKGSCRAKGLTESCLQNHIAGGAGRQSGRLPVTHKRRPP